MIFQKIVIMFAIFIMVFHPVVTVHGTKEVPAKVAFLRDGNVWVYAKGTEIQVSKSGKAMGSEWSIDGKLLSRTA